MSRSTSVAEQAAGRVLAQPTVLVVDDEKTFTRRLSLAFESEGFSVESAFGPKAALAMAAANPPDLVILDVRMPDLDGVRCARLLRERPDLAETPILFVTGDPSFSLDRLGRRDHLLRKPCTYEEVVAAAKSVLSPT